MHHLSQDTAGQAEYPALEQVLWPGQNSVFCFQYHLRPQLPGLKGRIFQNHL